MSSRDFQQGQAYNLVQDRNNATSGNTSPHNKALIKNLKAQSPFNEGARNKDYVNPTLASNLVFYDHGNVPVSNPHINVDKKNPNGYNLNNYVGWDIKQQRGPQDAQKQDAQNLPVRKGGEASSKQYTRVEKEKRPTVDEDARSVNTSRHYDRSQRSNKSGQNTPENTSQRSGRSQDNKSQKGSTQDNKSQRSTSNNGNRSQRSVSQGGTNYQKLSTSNISNPDNLICDNCVNHKIHDDKVDNLGRQRAQDREHAQRVGDNMRQQLADEKQRHLEKLRLHQNAVDQQRADHQNRKENDRAKDALEDEKYYKMITSGEGIMARQQRDIEANRERHRQEFVEELRDQLVEGQERKQLKAQEAWELDQKNHNTLIDDGWKEPHRRALKQHYKDNLLNQLDDLNIDKEAQRNQKKEDDAKYRKEVTEAAEGDKALRQELDAQKRQIFQEEIQNQMAEKRRLAEVNDQIKNLEDENHRRKINHDEQVHLDNLRRKQGQMQDHLAVITRQMQDRQTSDQLAKGEAKQPGNTTLLLNEKQHKCYNCSKCRNAYPLKLLNKKKRVK